MTLAAGISAESGHVKTRKSKTGTAERGQAFCSGSLTRMGCRSAVEKVTPCSTDMLAHGAAEPNSQIESRASFDQNRTAINETRRSPRELQFSNRCFSCRNNGKVLRTGGSLSLAKAPGHGHGELDPCSPSDRAPRAECSTKGQAMDKGLPR